MVLHEDPVPLRVDESGAVRIGNTRVLFYLVVHAHQSGNSPETIVEMYDTLSLADVYAVIAYYLRHRDEVEAFLVEVEKGSAEIRRKIEANQPPREEVRKRLEARRALMEQERAASGQ
jgi:uncharacterized protein (DUF433 family)